MKAKLPVNSYTVRVLVCICTATKWVFLICFYSVLTTSCWSSLHKLCTSI